MTLFDAAVAALVVVAASIGWRLGLARVVFPLAAAGLVVWLSARFANDLIVAHTSPAQVVVRGWLTLAAFVLLPLLAAMLASTVPPWTRSAAGRAAAVRRSAPPRPSPCWRRRCGSSRRCRSASTPSCRSATAR
jgi:hypothetical protein